MDRVRVENKEWENTKLKGIPWAQFAGGSGGYNGRHRTNVGEDEEDKGSVSARRIVDLNDVIMTVSSFV